MTALGTLLGVTNQDGDEPQGPASSAGIQRAERSKRGSFAGRRCGKLSRRTQAPKLLKGQRRRGLAGEGVARSARSQQASSVLKGSDEGSLTPRGRQTGLRASGANKRSRAVGKRKGHRLFRDESPRSVDTFTVNGAVLDSAPVRPGLCRRGFCLQRRGWDLAPQPGRRVAEAAKPPPWHAGRGCRAAGPGPPPDQPRGDGRAAVAAVGLLGHSWRGLPCGRVDPEHIRTPDPLSYRLPVLFCVLL